MRMRISLGQQIEEIDFQIRRASDEAGKLGRSGKIIAADARMHVLRLEEAKKTLELIARFEKAIRATLEECLHQAAMTSGSSCEKAGQP